MKNRIWLLVVAILLMGSIAFGATYQETKDAGIAQLNAKDFAGARATLAEAVTLGTTPYEKWDAGWYICISFYNEGKWAECRTACADLLKTGMTDAEKPRVQFRIASSWWNEGNYVEAAKAYDITITAATGVDEGSKALALLGKANCARATGGSEDDLLAAYLKVAVAKETPGIWKVASYLDMGDHLTKLERVAEAQEMYLKSAINGGTIAQFQEAIDKIDPAICGVDKKLAYLVTLRGILSGKNYATKENAEFISQVGVAIQILKVGG